MPVIPTDAPWTISCTPIFRIVIKPFRHVFRNSIFFRPICLQCLKNTIQCVRLNGRRWEDSFFLFFFGFCLFFKWACSFVGHCRSRRRRQRYRHCRCTTLFNQSALSSIWVLQIDVNMCFSINLDFFETTWSNYTDWPWQSFFILPTKSLRSDNKKIQYFRNIPISLPFSVSQKAWAGFFPIFSVF